MVVRWEPATEVEKLGQEPWCHPGDVATKGPGRSRGTRDRVNLTKKRQKNKTQHNIAVVSTGEESSKRALLEPWRSCQGTGKREVGLGFIRFGLVDGLGDSFGLDRLVCGHLRAARPKEEAQAQRRDHDHAELSAARRRPAAKSPKGGCLKRNCSAFAITVMPCCWCCAVVSKQSWDLAIHCPYQVPLASSKTTTGFSALQNSLCITKYSCCRRMINFLLVK